MNLPDPTHQTPVIEDEPELGLLAQPPIPADEDWPHGWMGEFLRALRVLPNVSDAARAAGITRTYAYEVRDGNPEFRRAWTDALAQARDLLKRYAWQLGTQGIQRRETRTRVKMVNGREVERETVTVEGRLVAPQLTMFLLRAHDPEMYGRDVNVRHSGPGGGPIPVEHSIMRPTDPQRGLELARIAAELEGPTVEVEDEPVHPDIEGEVVEPHGS